jgi:hypothetical protein
MRRFLGCVVLVLLVTVASGAVSAAETCVRTDDVCVSTDGGTVSGSVDIGAIDAQADLAPPTSAGATADAGAVDVQAGTDRTTCADAGSINVPPEQEQCPPS